MKVIFKPSKGPELVWDGLLWSGPADAKLLTALNAATLPEGGPHDSVMDRARRLLTGWGFMVRESEIVEDTGWPEEFLGADVIIPLEELEDSEDDAENASHDGTTETSPRLSTLAAAELHTRGGVCPSGADADGAADEFTALREFLEQETDGDEWEQPQQEWAALIKWAHQGQRLLSGPGPDRETSREHGTLYPGNGRRWVKFTLPNLAGYTADWTDAGVPFLRNARPGEYFDRLHWQNKLFGDDIRLAGLWQDGGGGWRIVTTQPHVAGEAATPEEIRAGMTALGFVRLPWTGIGYENSESWRIGRVCVWDVHPANVVRTESGLIVPIDVIITPLPDGFPPCHFHP